MDSRRNPPVVTLTLAGAASLWATPQAHDVALGNPARVGRFGTKAGGRNLTDDATAWLSPQASDAIRGPKSRREASSKYKDPAGKHSLATESASWSTPRAPDGEKGSPNMSFGAGGTPLPTQAAHWPTPTLSIVKGSSPDSAVRTGGIHIGMSRMDNLAYAAELGFRPQRPVPATRSGPASPTNILSCYRRFRATTDSALRSEIKALLRMGVRSRGRRVDVAGLRRPVFRGWTRQRAEPFVRPSFRRRLNPTFVEWLMRMPFGLSGFEREATELTRWLAQMRTCLSALHSPSIEPEPQGRLL